MVEVESAGGVGNLVKYWPWLRERTDATPLVIAHVFRLTSDNDYSAHRRLWLFLIERMREDLELRGVRWGVAWRADIFSYRSNQPADFGDVSNYLRQVLVGAAPAPE